MPLKRYLAFPTDANNQPKVIVAENQIEASIPCIELHWDVSQKKPWPDEVEGWVIVKCDEGYEPQILHRVRDFHSNAQLDFKKAKEMGWIYF